MNSTISAEGEEEGEKIHIHVKTLNNNTFEFDGVDVNATVLEFQAMVKEKTGIDENRQRIIYRGKMLKSTEKLSTYKIRDGHTLHLCARPLEATPSDRSYEDRESTARNRRRELFSSLLSSAQMGGSAGGARPLVLSNQIAAQLGRNTLVRGASNQNGEQNDSNARGAFARPQTAQMEHVWQGLLTLNTLMSTMNIASSTEIAPDWQDAPSVPPFCEENEDDDDAEMKEGEKRDDEEKVVEWKRKFFVGQWLDVKDTVNQWLEATVLRISDTRLYITYNGWPSRWDEWIEHTSNRIAPFRTKTLHASTSPHMSPSPISWIANAPSTGPNDVRLLISSVKSMIERTMPMIERFNQLFLSSSTPEEDEEKEEEDSLRNSEQLQAYARELAPVLDRLGRIVSDVAPQIAQINRPHVQSSTLQQQQQQQQQQNTTTTENLVHMEDENNAQTSRNETEEPATTTTTTEQQQQEEENVENTFTQLISTASNSPHLARRQGNVDIHIHAILTPYGQQQQQQNGGAPTTTSNSNNQNITFPSLSSGTRLQQRENGVQARFRSSRGMPLPFGPMLRPPSTSEGSTSTGITTSHPSNQQSAIRERLGDSLVSMIRRYRGGGGGGGGDSTTTTTTATTTTTSGDVIRTSARTTPSNSADALSAALNNSLQNNNRNDPDRDGEGGGGSGNNGNGERPSACSQQID